MSSAIDRGQPVVGRLPFLLNFVEAVDEAVYGESIRESDTLRDTYDPVTQTSGIDIYAGTTKTYVSTYTSTWTGTDKHDDSRVDDT